MSPYKLDVTMCTLITSPVVLDMESGRLITNCFQLIYFISATLLDLQKTLFMSPDQSLGGLGKDNSVACVSNITVENIIVQNALSGVRIKTWQVL